jgi:hypothetical protein
MPAMESAHRITGTPARGLTWSHVLLVVWLPAAVLLLAGCGSSQPAHDPAPFQVAIEQYLKQNGMALRIKEIEEGPVVSGTQATMQVSLTHAELGGPSVVWQFEFEQDAGGKWRVVRHKA